MSPAWDTDTSTEIPANTASFITVFDSAIALLDSQLPSESSFVSSVYFQKYTISKNVGYLRKSILTDEWVLLGQIVDKESFFASLANKYTILYEHTLCGAYLKRALGMLLEVVIVPPSGATMATGSDEVKPSVADARSLDMKVIEVVDQMRIVLSKLWVATGEKHLQYLHEAIAVAEHWLVLTCKKDNTDNCNLKSDQELGAAINSKELNDKRYKILAETLAWVIELQIKSNITSTPGNDQGTEAAVLVSLIGRYILALTSIFTEDEVIESVLPGMPPKTLLKMGKALTSRYQEYCNAADADKCLHIAIAMLKVALDKETQQEQKSQYGIYLGTLETMYKRRFGKGKRGEEIDHGEMLDVDTSAASAWDAQRKAMAKFTEYRNFGGDRFAIERHRQLDEAIAFSRKALQHARMTLLDEKADCIKEKSLPRIENWSRSFGEMVLQKVLYWCDEHEDQEENTKSRDAVRAMVKEEVVANSAEKIFKIKPQARTMALVNLSRVLYALYQRDPARHGHLFKEAIRHANDVLDIVKDAFRKGTMSELAARNALSSFYMTEYQRSGKTSDLSIAIKHMIKFLRSQKPHQDYGLHGKIIVRFKTIAGLFMYLDGLNTLAAAYAQRYQSTENYEDLENALNHQRKAVQYSNPDRVLKAEYQAALSSYLMLEYESGRVTGQEDQKRLVSEAVTHANAAWAVLQHDGEPQVATDCYFVMTRATNILNKLTTTQLDKNDQTWDPMTAALTMAFIASDTKHFKSSDLARSWHQFSKLFELSGDPEERATASIAAWQALENCPKELPSFRAELLYYKAKAMAQNIDTLVKHDEILSDLKECYETTTALPSIRLKAAVKSCYMLGESKQWTECYQTASSAMGLFYLLPINSLSPRDQQKLLQDFSGFGSRAAAAALEAGLAPGEALRLLEQGRDLIARQRFNIRTDLKKLAENNHGDLVARFTRLRNILDNTSLVRKPVAAGGHDILNDVAGKRARASEALQKLIEEIRSKPGFQDFLKPATVEEMKQTAEEGAIVVINVTEWRCDAFIIPKLSKENRDIEAIRLDKLSQHEINTHLGIQNPADKTSEEQLGDLGVIDMKFLDYLWTAIAKPVLQVEALQCKKDLGADPDNIPVTSYPRIWWCATGTASRLPIHAATSKKDSRESVMRRAVSSYTSSIKALIFSRAQAALRRSIPPNNRGRTALLCSVATNHIKEGPWSSLRVLENACHEVKRVEGVIESMHTLPKVGDQNTCLIPRTICDPTERSLLFSLNPQRSSDPEQYPAVFHFAGHGYSHPTDPSKSCLITADSPLEVGELMGVKIYENAPILAYLSACGTGVNSQNGVEALTDEGIHVMGAMQLVGFMNVVGSLWNIGDSTSRKVARRMYELWLQSDEGMSWEKEGQVARSLHSAVMELRTKSKISTERMPKTWAPFIHMGV